MLREVIRSVELHLFAEAALLSFLVAFLAACLRTWLMPNDTSASLATMAIEPQDLERCGDPSDDREMERE